MNLSYKYLTHSRTTEFCMARAGLNDYRTPIWWDSVSKLWNVLYI